MSTSSEFYCLVGGCGPRKKFALGSRQHYAVAMETSVSAVIVVTMSAEAPQCTSTQLNTYVHAVILLQ